MAPNKTPLLEVAGVSKRFGATVALGGVDLCVQPGEVHAVIGENGAGKSTLMRVVAGAERPDRGEMRFVGERYAPATPLDAKRHGITLIHQELSLCPHLSVAENLLLGTESARRGWIDRRASLRRAMSLLAYFPHPDIHPDRRVGALPMPARQVVEIGRALAGDTRLILMDEPTSSLGRDDTARLFALIRLLAERGIAVIYISHMLEEVRQIASHYTILRDGRSVDQGALASASTEHLITAMVGRPVSVLFPDRSRRQPGEVVLRVDRLSSPPRLEEASFELRRGEILGIAGLVGSGRTDLVRALFALGEARGEVTLRGRALLAARATSARRIRDGFGFLSEDRAEGLALAQSVADNLTITNLAPVTRRRVAAWIDRGRQRATALRLMRELDIRARSPDQPVRSLSGGNQQKVAIGRLLHQDADVLLLDEPTRGIDIGSKVQAYEILARVVSAGKAVLMVSSDLPELFGMCDRLAIMYRGRLSTARPIEQWTPAEARAVAIGG
jgi:ribose transport system ATP-binding protein